MSASGPHAWALPERTVRGRCGGVCARGGSPGRTLIERLIQQAVTAGAPGLSLHVSAEDERSQHLYRSWGFVVVDNGGQGLVMLEEILGPTRGGRPSS